MSTPLPGPTADQITAMLAVDGLPDELRRQLTAVLDTMTSAPLTEPEIPVVVLAPGARGDQLVAKYSQVKPQVDALTKELKEITDAIKVEAMMAMASIGAKDAVDLHAPSLERPLRFSSHQRTTVDSKALKATHPDIYAEVSNVSTVWTLKQVSG
jgi:hypothetical protein